MLDRISIRKMSRGGLVLGAALLASQAVYYLTTGVWPNVSMDTFLQVTGPKFDNLASGASPDHCLVLTVAALVTAISLPLLMSACERSVSLPGVVVAVGAAAGLMTIDILFVARGVIDRVYLLDAVAEGGLIAGWTAVFIERRRVVLGGYAPSHH